MYAFGVTGLGRLGLVLAIVELGVRGHKTVYLYFPEKVLVVRVAIEPSRLLGLKHESELVVTEEELIVLGEVNVEAVALRCV